MTSTIKITPLIMCGGAGTRLWPLSRETQPKQFAPLVGGTSTFQQVLERVNDPQVFARPIVITNLDFRFTAADQIQKSGMQADILLEPVGRDSGPAIAAAAEFASRRDRGAILLVLASDHIIHNVEEFRRSCQSSLSAATAGRLVTFGVHPTGAATSYGYIKPGEPIDSSPVLAVAAFVEKPDFLTAQRYVREGYLWNSGNFLFSAETMLHELARLEPAMRSIAQASVDGIVRDLDFFRLSTKFAEAPKKSIDYAVMERTGLTAVLPVSFGWSDIGSWGALWEELAHDAAGNRVEGPVHLLNTQNSLVISDTSILTTLIGLDDIVVISTPDAVLVVPKNRSEEVKELVAALRVEKRPEVREHRRVHICSLGSRPQTY